MSGWVIAGALIAVALILVGIVFVRAELAAVAAAKVRHEERRVREEAHATAEQMEHELYSEEMLLDDLIDMVRDGDATKEEVDRKRAQVQKIKDEQRRLRGIAYGGGHGTPEPRPRTSDGT